jgi:hypothetical protein
MLVIPTQSEVTLVYGQTLGNKIGISLAALGWIIVLFIIVINIFINSKKKKIKSLNKEELNKIELK